MPSVLVGGVAGPALERALERALLGEADQVLDVDQAERRVLDVAERELVAGLVADRAVAGLLVGEAAGQRARQQAEVGGGGLKVGQGLGEAARDDGTDVA